MEKEPRKQRRGSDVIVDVPNTPGQKAARTEVLHHFYDFLNPPTTRPLQEIGADTVINAGKKEEKKD